MKYLDLEIRNSVAIVWLDRQNAAVNSLNEEVIGEFKSVSDAIETNKEVKAVVFISRKADTFIAGADLEVIRDATDPAAVRSFNEEGNRLLDRLAAFPKPVVAAVHGAAMGGGLEVALACHYIIVTDSSKTKLALPEVKLGLLPGAGGTQRLPKRVGISAALDMMLTGKNIFARKAKSMGLADMVVHKDALLDVAIDTALKLADKKIRRPEVKRTLMQKLLDGTRIGRRIVYSQAKKTVLRQTYGNYPAPLKIIESAKAGIEKGTAAGRQTETDGFVHLVFTPQSRSLVDLFFGMQNAKKNPWKEHLAPINTIGVIGAGLMGSGIAQVSAENGYNVLLKDRDLAAAAKGRQEIVKQFNDKVKKRILSGFERDCQAERITATGNYEGFQHADLVIEAVFEDLNLKQRIIRDLETVIPERCIVASNTSSLPISLLADASKRPENVLGMHYFSPVQKMPLLEIIKTPKTSPKALAVAYEAGVKQGKTVIVVNDGPGFYTTRILAPLMNEALLLLEEGADALFIDKAMKQYGFPVGPIVLFDEVGIDVAAHINDVMGPFFAVRGAKPTSVTKDLYKAGFHGRKNGKGFFLYDGKKKTFNKAVYQFFGGDSRKSFDRTEVQERIAFMMVNEALLCLQDGILESAQDGDLGAILGLGFPPFTGGPFRFVDSIGVQQWVGKMEAYRARFGERFRPADIAVEYAKAGKKFRG
jgi:3-hydroxyacyl-CoA dehydrogenase/enoyl-CoA hydratase/3-hydroxybutyryl-CoA epimerase